MSLAIKFGVRRLDAAFLAIGLTMACKTNNMGHRQADGSKKRRQTAALNKNNTIIIQK
jgi:hypothetical protein